MQYRIATLDGYKFHYEATEDSCIDIVEIDAIRRHPDAVDFVFANESELLAWVAENIDNIGLFERSGFDSVIGI